MALVDGGSWQEEELSSAKRSAIVSGLAGILIGPLAGWIYIGVAACSPYGCFLGNGMLIGGSFGAGLWHLIMGIILVSLYARALPRNRCHTQRMTSSFGR